MALFDSKVKKSFSHYLVQSVLAGISVTIILIFLNLLTEAAIVAALGSSAFIVFAMPGSVTARPRNLIGGHLTGVGCGLICSVLVSMVGPKALAHLIFAALAVGLSILIMCITNTEHPPASGTALGLVAHGWSVGTVSFILISVIMLSFVKHLLRNYLKDLV